MAKEMTAREFCARYWKACKTGMSVKRSRNVRMAKRYKKNIHIAQTYDRDKVLEILRRIHETGGCDAVDEYSKGWDAAITEAIRIVEDVTGLSVRDVI